MNFLKRLVALLIIFAMLIPTVSFAEETDDVFVYLSSLGIMIGDDTGDFREDDNLTRAEFSAIAARLLRVPNMKQGQIFADVPADHWANGYISQIYKMGIINGTGNNLFSPDSHVTYEQAIKILVGVLGYGVEAEKNGGFPSGYLGMGISLKLNDDLNLKGEALTRGEIAQMVYNTLQAHPLTSYGTPDYTREDRTLGEIISSSMEVVCIEGVVNETYKSSLLNTTPGVLKGEAVVNGVHIKTNADLKLGYYAQIYAEENRGKYTLINVTYPTQWNNVTVANADGASLNAGIFTYLDENDKEKTVKLDGMVTYIYNGRKTGGYKTITEGTYTLVDNNADRYADVVFIDEPESFYVNRVNKSKSMVYFDKSVIFRGRNAIQLDMEDEDKIISVKTANGKSILPGDIEAGYALTIKQSEDGKCIDVVVSSDAIEGTITEVSEKGFVINGTEYEVAYANGINYASQFALSNTGVFILDCFGKLLALDEGTKNTGYIYAYCMDAKNGEGLQKGVKIQTISSAAPVKEVTLQNDDEIISYLFQNNDPQEYTLAEKIKFNGTNCNNNEIDFTKLINSFVAFKLNGNGEIKELYYESLAGRGRKSYNFNAEIMTFGGSNDSRGYVTNKNTTFVLVPEVVSSDEDYMVGVTLTDEQTSCKVYGTVFFADDKYESVEVQPVDILMIKADMNSTVAPLPTLYDDICIVGEVRAIVGSIRDDAGATVYRISLLNGTSLKEEVTTSYGTAFNVASGLKKGDLIRYKKDGFGRINSISKICSTQGLGTAFNENMYLTSTATAKFGYVYSTVTDTFDYYSNTFVDKLSLSFQQDGSYTLASSEQIKISKDGEMPVYLFNRTTGWVEPGNLDDAVASMYAGGNASKAFVLLELYEVKAVVIIED